MMLRFFASVIGCVAMLSGGLMGWVRYAQIDPDYSCLSFDNITVQLDTSLFMRQFYPLALQGIYNPYYSYGEDFDVIVETRLPHVNRLYPIPHFVYPSSAVPSQLVLIDRSMGRKYILEESENQGSVKGTWSSDKSYFAYAWNNGLHHTVFKIIDTRSNIYFQMGIEAQDTIPVGWTSDNRYLVFVSSTEYLNKIYTVDTESWHYQVTEVAGSYPFTNALMQRSHFSFVANNVLYIFDILEQQFLSYPLLTNTLAIFSWSPDENYIALGYLQKQVSENSEEYNLYEMHILAIKDAQISEIAEYTWQSFTYDYPQWAQDSNNLFWKTQETGSGVALARYNVAAKQASIMFRARNSSLPEFTHNHLILSNNGVNDDWNVKIWSLGDQTVVYQREALTFRLLPSPDNTPFIYFELLNDENRYEIYQLNLETLRDEMLFYSPFYPEPKIAIEVARINIIESSGDLLRFLSIHLSTKSTSVFTLVEDAPHTQVDSIMYQPSLALWFIAIRNTNNGHTKLYKISLNKNTIDEIVSFETNMRQEIIYSSISPDDKYLTLVIHDYSSYTQEFFVISLQENTLFRLGTFFPSSKPVWTQCTY